MPAFWFQPKLPQEWMTPPGEGLGSLWAFSREKACARKLVASPKRKGAQMKITMLRFLLVLVFVLSPVLVLGSPTETANGLYVEAYRLEGSKPAAAIETYERILDEWPDSEAAIKAIDRIELLKTRDGLPSGESPAPAVTFDTSHGDITVELFSDEAPETVERVLAAVEAGYLKDKDFLPRRNHVLLNLPVKLSAETNQLIPAPGSVWVVSRGDRGETYLGILASNVEHLVATSATVIGRVVEGMELVDEIASIEPRLVDVVPPTVEIERVEEDALLFVTSAGDFAVELFDDPNPNSPVHALRRAIDSGALDGRSLEDHPAGTVAVRLPDDLTLDPELVELLEILRKAPKEEIPEAFLKRVQPPRGAVSIEQDVVQPGASSASMATSGPEILLHFHVRDTPDWHIGKRFAIGRVSEGMDVTDEIEQILGKASEFVYEVPNVTIEGISVDLQNTRPAQEVAPECADPAVLATAREVVFDLLWEKSAPGRALAALAGGKPAQEDDIGKFTIEDVRTVHTRPDKGGRSCRANVYRWVLSRQQQIPATYEVELLDNQPGRFHVYVRLDFDAAAFVNSLP